MNIRKMLAASTVLIVLLTLSWALYICIPARPADDIPFKTAVQESLKVKQDQSSSAFHLSLLMLGGLWATLLAKKDETTFSFNDVPATTMFVCSNILLLTSIYFHLDYLSSVSGHLWNAGKVNSDTVPDFYNSFLNNPYSSQIVSLVGGIISAALHLIGIHKFT